MTASRLRTIAAVAAVVLVADLVWLNVDGEVPDGWWIVAVPVGLFVVPVVGLAALLLSFRADEMT